MASFARCDSVPLVSLVTQTLPLLPSSAFPLTLASVDRLYERAATGPWTLAFVKEVRTLIASAQDLVVSITFVRILASCPRVRCCVFCLRDVMTFLYPH